MTDGSLLPPTRSACSRRSRPPLTSETLSPANNGAAAALFLLSLGCVEGAIVEPETHRGRNFFLFPQTEAVFIAG